MPRVNVEDSAIHKSKKLAFILGEDTKRILGCLVTMWHETQSMGLCVEPAYGIYSMYFKPEKEEIGITDLRYETWLEAMIELKFLLPTNVDEHGNEHDVDACLVQINGNVEHINRLKKLKELARLGGQAHATSARSKRTVEVKGKRTLKPNTVQYSTVQYSTNNTKESCSTGVERDFDLDEIYKRYPRKQGKQSGMSRLNAQIKTKEEFSLVNKALDSYIAHIEKNKVESKFIQMFSTWVNNWRDWLDADAGQVKKISECLNDEEKQKKEYLKSLTEKYRSEF